MAGIYRKTSPNANTRAGSKRAASSPQKSSPATKRAKTPIHKEGNQQTIEESMTGIEDDSTVAEQLDDKSEKNGHAESNGKASKTNGSSKEAELKAREDAVKEREDAADAKEQNGDKESGNEESGSKSNGLKNGEKNAFDEVKSGKGEVKEAAKKEESEKAAAIKDNQDSVVEDPEREKAVPSSILEKGIIYFFFRGRVGVESPSGIEDIARSYIVLRPLPLGAKIGSGPLADDGNARLLALPKKVLPQSPRDRFLVFVEKPKEFVKDLKENFVNGVEYATKTTGTSSVPDAQPIAEGVYALTSTGRDSHLAYTITAPAEMGELQKDIGLAEKGSYVVSCKNSTASGPANASLPQSAEYPESIMKRFGGRRWAPLEPEMLGYANTQFLIIGEERGEHGKAMEEQSKDKKDKDTEKPVEEMEKLEDEDSIRVEHLKGDDPVFADLGLSSQEYPKMSTTW